MIAYPILISTLIEQLIGMTDTAFLGRVSEVALGASALAGVYYMVLFMIGLGFSIGVQIIIGRRNGEGNYHHSHTEDDACYRNPYCRARHLFLFVIFVVKSVCYEEFEFHFISAESSC